MYRPPSDWWDGLGLVASERMRFPFDTEMVMAVQAPLRRYRPVAFQDATGRTVSLADLAGMVRLARTRVEAERRRGAHDEA